MSAQLNAHVVAVHVFRPGLFSIKVALDGPVPAPEYHAGQYATLGLLLPEGEPDPYREGERRRPAKGAGLLRRSYSIASPPHERRHVEFYVVEVDQGKLTPLMSRLKAGDPIFMAERFQGRMTLEDAAVASSHDVVCLATGTGLSPFVSFVREHAAFGRWRKIAIMHSVRASQDLGYRAALEALAAQYPDTVHYIPTLTRPEAGWNGRHGRVQGAFDDGTLTTRGFALDPANTHVFLCGAPQMIDDTEAMLKAKGFTPWKPKVGGNLHLERFW